MAADYAALSAPDPAPVPEIRCDLPGSYPYSVLTRRHPVIIGQVRAGQPYGPRQLSTLDELAAEITGEVRPFPPGAPGQAHWDILGAPWFGRPWLELPFLWAEGYFYAKLLHAVGYDSDGPWRGIDPFAPMKAAELDSPGYADDLAALAKESDLRELLIGAVWGNRADLGFLIDAAPGTADAPASHLLVDQSAALAQELTSGRVRRLGVLADNAGRELLADLVLIDHLLTAGTVESVVLHLKPHPYFISDATLTDLLATLSALANGPEAARELAARLDTALRAGRLTPATHWFSGLPYRYQRMPADLRAELAGCDLVLSKGDLNYRRLVSDRHWPPTTEFAALVDYFPTRLAALRAVKSDVAVGLDPADVRQLDAADPGWRTAGRYAVVQTRLVS